MKSNSGSIFNGEFIKLLKEQLKFKDAARIVTGVDDPTVVATEGEAGSLYMQLGGTNALYQKLDDGVTVNWTPFVTSAPPNTNYRKVDGAPGWRSITVPWQVIAAGGGTTTAFYGQDFIFGRGSGEGMSMLPGEFVHGVAIIPNTQFVGAVGSLNVSLGNDVVADRYASAYDVFTAPSNSNFQLTQCFDAESMRHRADTLLTVTAAANLNLLTAGDFVLQLLTSNINGERGLPNQPSWYKFTVDFDDLSDVGFVHTTILQALPSGSVVTGVVIKPTAAFAGGDLTDYTVEVGVTGATSKYYPATSVVTLSTSDSFLAGSTIDVPSYSTPINLTITARSTGEFLNNVTTGCVELWVMVSALNLPMPNYTPTNMTWFKYSVPYSTLSVAGLSKTVDLFETTGDEIIHAVVVKHPYSFVAPGLATMSAEVGIVGTTDKYALAFDVAQAVSDTALEIVNFTTAELIHAKWKVQLTGRSVGANLNTLTAGVVNIYVLKSRMS